MEIKPFKIRNLDPDESRIIQETLFKNGYRWSGRGTEIQKYNEMHLYTDGKMYCGFISSIPELTFEEFERMYIKEEPPIDESPMAKKFRLKREERDRIKAKQSQSDEGAITFETLLGSLCIMGLGITPFNAGDLTIYTAKCLLERAQAKEQYDTELRILMAGADSKKIKPKYLVRNLDN